MIDSLRLVREVPVLMRFLVKPAIFVAQAVYLVLRLLPRRDKIVLLSRQSDLPSRDFLLLVEELRRQDPSVDTVIRCRFIKDGILARTAYVGEILVQMYHLATARVCVLDGYIVPVSVLSHGSGLYVMQLWHALGALKRFGYQSLGQPGARAAALARAMRMHRNYDAVICGGPASIESFAAAFDVDPGIVLPLGLPRVDYLREACRSLGSKPPVPAVAQLRENYPRLADTSKLIVLYAPTFRRNWRNAYQEVIEAFSDGRFTLIVKPHDLESVAIAGTHVVDAKGVDVTDLLPLCDVVVTDYSAVAFEAACIGKPVYYFVFDIEEYREALGLNIDPLERMPTVSSARIDELVERIASQDHDPVAAQALQAGYVPPGDQNSTARIAGLILSHIRRVS